MKPKYFTYIRIKNGNTILVSSFSMGIVDKLEVELINESWVTFSSLAFDGAATRYCYSIVENTWDYSTTRYSGSTLDTLLSEKISFNNEIEFTPVEAYNPATKKYVDDSIANIAEHGQADWNQNDPGVSDYVKNRPFYEGYKILGTFLRGENNLKISLTAGKSYIVDCDGVAYTVVCEQLSNGKGLRAFKEGVDGALFLIYETSQTIRADRAVVMDPDELVIYKLDEKFIPDTIARANDIGEAATDDEIVDILIQEDMLFALTDSTGSILTDENNNILTW